MFQSSFAGPSTSSTSSTSSSSASPFAMNSNQQNSPGQQHFQGGFPSPQAYMTGSGQNLTNFNNTSSPSFSTQSNHSGNSFFANNQNINNRPGPGSGLSLSPPGKNFLPSLPGSSAWIPQQGGVAGSQLSSRGIPQQNYGQGMQQNQYNQASHPSNSMQLPAIQMQFPGGNMGNMGNMLMNNQPGLSHSSASTFSSSATPAGAGSPLKESGEYGGKKGKDEKGSKSKKNKKFSVPKNPASLTVKSLVSWKDKAARLAEEGKGHHAVEILKVLTTTITKEPASFQLLEPPAQAKKWTGTGIENHQFPRQLGNIWASALNCSDVPMSEYSSLVSKLEEWQASLLRNGYGANASDKGFVFEFAIHLAKKKVQMMPNRGMMGGEVGRQVNQDDEEEDEEEDDDDETESVGHKRSRENERSSNKKAKTEEEDESDRAYVEEYTRKYGSLEGKVQGGKIQIAGRLFHVNVYLDYLYNKGQSVGNKFAALSREQQAEVLSGAMKLT